MRVAAFWLSLLLVFTIPWEDAFNVAGLGTLTRMIGVLSGISWLSLVLFERRFRKAHPLHMFMYLFVLWNMVSFFWSGTVAETEQQIKTYLQLSFLAWILWDLYTTPKALRLALEAYILGAYVAIASTIINFLIGHRISLYEERYAGTNVNANDLALILALGLPVAWYLAPSKAKGKKDRLLGLLHYAYLPAAFAAILLTASRTALFAVVPAVVYILGTANRLKPSYRLLILAALLGTLPFIPQSSVQRLATIRDSLSLGDLGGRGTLWAGSITVFSKQPLLGVGSGALKTATFLGGVAHNTFLSVLAELGLIGFTLFVGMLAIVAYQAAKQPKWLSGLWLSILAVWCIGAFTLTWEYRKPTWLFLSLVVISADLFRRGDCLDEGPPLPARAPVFADLSRIHAKG